MNYSMDNRIWRVGGPLFAYIAISFGVQLVFSLGIFYAQFNEWNIGAAFNGLMYAEQLIETEQLYAVAISGVSAAAALPVFAVLLKRDYEYPVNRRIKERSFDLKIHIKALDRSYIPVLALVGVFAAIGLSRLILMLPLDGILGDYGEIKAGYEAADVWLQLLVLGILIPIVEEMLFRGLVYNRLKAYYETTIATYISSLIFGIAHFNLIQGIYSFIMGIVFTFIYERCRYIYAPMIIHVVANLTAVITSINPVSKWVDAHVWVKLPLALVWTAAFAFAIVALYKKTENTSAGNEGKDSDKEETDKEEIHKIDFHI